MHIRQAVVMNHAYKTPHIFVTHICLYLLQHIFVYTYCHTSYKLIVHSSISHLILLGFIINSKRNLRIHKSKQLCHGSDKMMRTHIIRLDICELIGYIKSLVIATISENSFTCQSLANQVCINRIYPCLVYLYSTPFLDLIHKLYMRQACLSKFPQSNSSP